MNYSIPCTPFLYYSRNVEKYQLFWILFRNFLWEIYLVLLISCTLTDDVFIE